MTIDIAAWMNLTCERLSAEHEMTYIEIEELIAQLVGVSRSTIKAWKAGKRRPNIDQLLALIKADGGNVLKSLTDMGVPISETDKALSRAAIQMAYSWDYLMLEEHKAIIVRSMCLNDKQRERLFAIMDEAIQFIEN